MSAPLSPLKSFVAALLWFAVALGASARVAAEVDPGVELVLDRSSFVLEAHDRRTGERAPSVPVVLGSPAHPTPTGRYAIHRVILQPSWTPGDAARAAGARRAPASLVTPMGVAKIPFAEAGSVAIHGGGDPLLLGKPVSSGCVRASDADLLRLIAWLDGRGALGPGSRHGDGEILRHLVRRAQLTIR